MAASIVSLPSELLRQIIIELLHDPREPHRFYKTRLIPLSSTCRALRVASVEFLYWSVDLFEASFGLSHRVIKSSEALNRFNQLVDTSVGYVRDGVRRFLVRDRDGTASGDLWSIIEKLESLRSLHFDGPFFHHKGPQFPSAPENLLQENARISRTLCNLTFLGSEPRSLVFGFFFRVGVFKNLTRLEYHDTYQHSSDAQPVQHMPTPTSPFTQFQACTEPVFPGLSIFVFTYRSPSETMFSPIAFFIRLHARSIERLAVIDKQYGYHHESPPYRMLWPVLEEMGQLKLLGVSLNPDGPTRPLRLPKLRGLYIQFDSGYPRVFHLQSIEGDSLFRLCSTLGCPHVTFGDEFSNRRWVAIDSLQHVGFYRLAEWLQIHRLPMMKTIGRFSGEGIIVWDVTNTIEKGDIRLDGTSRHDVWAQVGWWSFEEDADKNEAFT